MASYLAACSTWQVQQAPAPQTKELRVTLAEGRRVLLRDPQIIGDSLVGFARGPASGSQPVRVAFRTTDVQRIEGRKMDAGNTALAVIGLGVVIGLVVALGNAQTTDPYR